MDLEHAERLAAVETKIDQVLTCLGKLVDKCPVCEQRLTRLEWHSRIVMYVGGVVIALSLFVARNAIWQSIQRMFI